ncbi:hypothetical protein AC578_10108 [Pseudocercospora eumusae]|uniref:Uncharacterized protein n=1 Tax=Pseudocercospora eumusae TaxID=321146 RepID=A0A139GZG1_9PEZI|nr:hypothetical protein AC578_10108 [Pseudocercospora eumusae]
MSVSKEKSEDIDYTANGHDHTANMMPTLEQVQTQGSITITPEMFERMYLAPQNKVSGGLGRTLGNPTPIGLGGFLIAYCPIIFSLLGWRGYTGNGAATVGTYYFSGGLLAIIAMILEFILGNTFPAVFFGVYGGYFLSYGATITPSFAAYLAYAPDPSDPSGGLEAPAFLSGLAFWNLMMGIFTIYCTICRRFLNGFVVMIIGWYLLLALMLTTVDFPLNLPEFDLSHVVPSNTELMKKRKNKKDLYIYVREALRIFPSRKTLSDGLELSHCSPLPFPPLTVLILHLLCAPMLARTSLRCFRSLARYQSGYRHVLSAHPRFIGEPREALDTHQAPSQRLLINSNQTGNTLTPPITLTEFETLAKHGAATIDQARTCLEHLKAQLMPLPMGVRREAAAKTDAGRKILLWLWTEYGSDPGAFLHTGQARIGPDLCWFLLAQGLEEYLWEWIKGEIPAAADLTSVSDFDSEYQRLCWVSPLLACLVEAHYDWAEDASLDAAMKAFGRARELFKIYGERGNEFVKIPSWILFRLVRADITCDASLYDNLIDYHHQMKKSDSRPFLWKFQLGMLALYHPSNPDPRPFLTWSRGCRVSNMRTKAGASIASYMLMAAYVLRHQSRADEASKLESFVEKYSPVVWQKRRTILTILDARESFREIRRDDVTIPWCD